MDILLKFLHGLGDAAQLTSVLAHLPPPPVRLGIYVTNLIDKHSVLQSLCHRSLRLGVDAVCVIVYDSTGRVLEESQSYKGRTRNSTNHAFTSVVVTGYTFPED